MTGATTMFAFRRDTEGADRMAPKGWSSMSNGVLADFHESVGPDGGVSVRISVMTVPSVARLRPGDREQTVIMGRQAWIVKAKARSRLRPDRSLLLLAEHPDRESIEIPAFL